MQEQGMPREKYEANGKIFSIRKTEDILKKEAKIINLFYEKFTGSGNTIQANYNFTDKEVWEVVSLLLVDEDGNLPTDEDTDLFSGAVLSEIIAAFFLARARDGANSVKRSQRLMLERQKPMRSTKV